ncbi:MAG: prolipoprotein diacylglyceryl transferase [Candidatus Promineifilaceae bacterium]
MYPVLPIGRLVIPTAPLIYLLGIYFSLSALERAAKSLQLPATRIYALTANSVIAGFVVARFVFVLQNFSDFMTEPLSIIWPLTNGYHVGSGLAAAVLIFLLLIRRNALPLAHTLDAAIVGVLVALAATSLADGLARASLGATTSVPWGIVTANVRRHPAAVYEIVVSLMAFAAWWRLSNDEQPDGHLFLATVGVLSFGRFLTEAFRTSAPTVGDGYRSVQLITLFITLAVMYRLSQTAETEKNQQITS